MTFVVLLDQNNSQTKEIQNRFSDNGLVAWMANDVSHALEELSDFTVRRRPDVVLLEVAFLPDSFDALRATFDNLSTEEKITVLGLTESESSGRGLMAGDVDQLAAMMQQELCVG